MPTRRSGCVSIVRTGPRVLTHSARCLRDLIGVSPELLNARQASSPFLRFPFSRTSTASHGPPHIFPGHPHICPLTARGTPAPAPTHRGGLASLLLGLLVLLLQLPASLPQGAFLTSDSLDSDAHSRHLLPLRKQNGTVPAPPPQVPSVCLLNRTNDCTRETFGKGGERRAVL